MVEKKFWLDTFLSDLRQKCHSQNYCSVVTKCKQWDVKIHKQLLNVIRPLRLNIAIHWRMQPQTEENDDANNKQNCLKSNDAVGYVLYMD